MASRAGKASPVELDASGWRGVDAFFGLVLLAFGGCQHKGEHAEGEQDGNDKSKIIICGKLY